MRFWYSVFFFLMVRRPPRSTRTDTLCPYTTLFRSGVNWYFERAVTDAGLPSAAGRTTWSTLAGSVLPALSGGGGGLGWTFLGRNAAAVISALDDVTDVQILQSPSVLVRNNAEATFHVGSKIPRSDERRVGKGWVSPCRYRWSPSNKK